MHSCARAKFIAEEKAGTFRFATWSMRRPGGVLANLGGGSIHSQAGVTVYPFKDILYALDEVSPAYGLDPQTLETIGEQTLGDPAREFMIKAHTKFDPLTGEWLLFGVSHGRSMKLHAIIHGADGALKAHHVIASPRQIYIHDFFATREHLIFVLHPMWFSPWRFLSGQASVIESLSWKPEDGNQVMVVPREGGTPQFFEAPAAFMWHALNAYSEVTRSSPISSAMTPPIISRPTMPCSTRSCRARWAKRKLPVRCAAIASISPPIRCAKRSSIPARMNFR